MDKALKETVAVESSIAYWSFISFNQIEPSEQQSLVMWIGIIIIQIEQHKSQLVPFDEETPWLQETEIFGWKGTQFECSKHQYCQ